MAGRDAVVNLIAILHGSAADFEQVHVRLPRRLAAACAAAGVPRLVHVSALGVGADAPSNYLRSKAAGEAVLQAAPLDADVLRPSVIFGADDRFLNLFAALQARGPGDAAGRQRRALPAGVGARTWPRPSCAACERPDTIGQTYECAGPQVCTLRELVRLAGRLCGPRAPQVLPLPEALGRLQALAMELLPGAPLMSRDNLLSMRVPNVASGQLPGLEALGIDGRVAGGGGTALPVARPGRGAPRPLARRTPALTAAPGGCRLHRAMTLCILRSDAVVASPHSFHRMTMPCSSYIGNKNYSSWSMRPWVLMRQLGIDFEEVQAALRLQRRLGLPREPWRASARPARVPVLVDDGFAVWDTLAIAEYLHEKFPRPGVWPADRGSARGHAACAPRCTRASARCASTAR